MIMQIDIFYCTLFDDIDPICEELLSVIYSC